MGLLCGFENRRLEVWGDVNILLEDVSNTRSELSCNGFMDRGVVVLVVVMVGIQKRLLKGVLDSLDRRSTGLRIGECADWLLGLSPRPVLGVTAFDIGNAGMKSLECTLFDLCSGLLSLDALARVTDRFDRLWGHDIFVCKTCAMGTLSFDVVHL